MHTVFLGLSTSKLYLSISYQIYRQMLFEKKPHNYLPKDMHVTTLEQLCLAEFSGELIKPKQL